MLQSEKALQKKIGKQRKSKLNWIDSRVMIWLHIVHSNLKPSCHNPFIHAFSVEISK
jgi:hypothetical protein